ncbi:MAG: hypothetical protein HY868_03710 [Chloroflexi bacterium]|nr:hypothetical protein [Chloroflexota bacterium]
MKRQIKFCTLFVLLFSLMGCSGGRTLPVNNQPTPVPATSTSTPLATNTSASTATASPTQTATQTATRAFSPTATSTRAPTATIVRPTPVVSTQVLLPYLIAQTKHPQAVCNDGSTPVFFYRRGTGDGVNKWVVWFKGGFNCSDEASCKARTRDLTGSGFWMRQDLSTGLDEDSRADGILSNQRTNNPDFYNWHHVYLVYCSSDNWIGSRSASSETFGMHFRGHDIVNAMMDALQNPDMVGTPTLAQATHILFAGSSAGGVGLRANIDRLAKQFNRADVRAVADSGIASAVDTTREALLTTMGKAELNLWKPVWDESCVAANQAQPWVCGGGTFLVLNNHLSTPLFNRMDQLDPVVLGILQLNLRSLQDRPLIEKFATQVREVLKNQPGAYSPFSGKHIVLTGEDFYRYKINGLSMADVLGNWYFNRQGPKNVIEPPRTR